MSSATDTTFHPSYYKNKNDRYQRPTIFHTTSTTTTTTAEATTNSRKRSKRNNNNESSISTTQEAKRRSVMVQRSSPSSSSSRPNDIVSSALFPSSAVASRQTPQILLQPSSSLFSRRRIRVPPTISRPLSSTIDDDPTESSRTATHTVSPLTLSSSSSSDSNLDDEENHQQQSLYSQVHDELRSMTLHTRLVPSSKSYTPRIGATQTHCILGVGTFSNVTCATIVASRRSTTTKKRAVRYYACKSVKGEFAYSNHDTFKNAVVQLAYEANVLRSLNHPNIIKLRGVSAKGLDRFIIITGTDNGNCDGIGGGNGKNHNKIDDERLFLLTDVLRETLGERIHRWRKKEEYHGNIFHQYRRNIHKCDICLQLSSALDYLHKKNIVYRDLKPENIGFDSKGTLQLFDFGLCHELNMMASSNKKAAKATGIVGTMRYMAPEVCMGYEYDTDCDVYSYAIVCWELWTLSVPYEMFTPEMYMEYVCRPNNGYRPTTKGILQQEEMNMVPPVVPKEVLALLSQAWKHEPSQRCRWSTIQEQLSLFKKLEELRMEEQELLLLS